MKLFNKFLIAVTIVEVMGMSGSATADKLDDVIKSGTLNCGVVLDFPPMGYFDENNKPVGFDCDYCEDLAKAIGV